MTTTRRGRPPKGAAHAQRVEGSDEVRQRLELILRTVSGEVSVASASEELGVSEAHFYRLRDRALQGAADALAPRPAGRPPSESSPSEAEQEAMAKELQDLRFQLRATEIREQIALVMPHLLQPPSEEEARKKKNRAKRKRRARKGRR